MPKPILTTSEKATIQKEAKAQTSMAALLTTQVSAKTARVTELGVIDGTFKRFMDYYSDDIIAQYETEKKELDGVFVTTPIVEQDIVDVSNISGRLKPTPPAVDIIRVPEFDGGNTSTTLVNETQLNLDTSDTSTALKTGFGGGTTTNATTTTTLLPGSTTLNVTNALAETIAINDVYVVRGGTDVGVIKVTAKADGGGADPPFLTTLTLTVLKAPTTSVPTGATLIVFAGFNNTERTSKTASNGSLQLLMDNLITDLESALNSRTARLNAQNTAIAANQDPDGTTQFTAQTALNETAKTFITNYLATTLITDVGLGSLDTERGTRTTEISTRTAQITANFTGQTENYYNQRYTFANDRGNLLRGTLRIQKITQASSAASTTYAANATASAGSLNSIVG